jgi:hypothetical protein
MKHHVTITTGSGFIPGIVQMLLANIHVPVKEQTPDGVIQCEMDDEQLRLFRLRGSAHKMDVRPAAPVVDPKDQSIQDLQGALEGALRRIETLENINADLIERNRALAGELGQLKSAKDKK